MVNLNLVRKLAWSYQQMTGMDYDELFSEACLGYAEALRTFDPNRNCQLSSYAWSVVKNRLRRFVKNENKHVKEMCFTSLFVNEANERVEPFSMLQCEESESFEEFLEGMTKEVKMLVEVIIRREGDLPNDRHPSWLRGKIVEILREEGWSYPKIRTSIRNLKAYLK